MEHWVVHLGLSGTLERPWGPPLSQKMTKACLKSSDIPLTTFHRSNTQFPIVESSHSAILYLDFSWNTRLSFLDHWGLWGGPLGAPSSQKTTKTCLKSSDILSFHETNTQFFPQSDLPIVKYCISTSHRTLGRPSGFWSAAPIGDKVL